LRAGDDLEAAAAAEPAAARVETHKVTEGAKAAADAASAARDAVAAALGLAPAATPKEDFAKAREEGQRKARAVTTKANAAVAKAEAALGAAPPLGSAAAPAGRQEEAAAPPSTTTEVPAPEDLEERMRGLMIAAKGDALANNDPKKLDRISASLEGALSAASTLKKEERRAKGVFRLDNGQLERKTWALAYRRSKNADDLDSKPGQHWGTHVIGVDEGNGWLKVDDGRYLPTRVQGKRVLIKESVSVQEYLKASNGDE
jgi:hypothetical protein